MKKTLSVEIDDRTPQEDLDVIRKYLKDPRDFEDFLEHIRFAEYVKYLADNKINKIFITRG